MGGRHALPSPQIRRGISIAMVCKCTYKFLAGAQFCVVCYRNLDGCNGRNVVVFIIIFFRFSWLCHTACGILVPQPGIEPAPPAVEVWTFNHWTAREVPLPTSYLSPHLTHGLPDGRGSLLAVLLCQH